jgi:hypothetical protein
LEIRKVGAGGGGGYKGYGLSVGEIQKKPLEIVSIESSPVIADPYASPAGYAFGLVYGHSYLVRSLLGHDIGHGGRADSRAFVATHAVAIIGKNYGFHVIWERVKSKKIIGKEANFIKKQKKEGKKDRERKAKKAKKAKK